MDTINFQVIFIYFTKFGEKSFNTGNWNLRIITLENILKLNHSLKQQMM